MVSSLFHPGQATYFPVDTLISAINSYMGFFYIQAREQLFGLFTANIDNPEIHQETFGEDLITTFESLDRSIVAGSKVLQVKKMFKWPHEVIIQFQRREYSITYEL